MSLLELEHLSLDDHGRVRLERLAEVCEDRPILGWVEDDPAWPVSLGSEPRWYLTELAELADAWQEGTREEFRRHVAHVFVLGLGTLRGQL